MVLYRPVASTNAKRLQMQLVRVRNSTAVVGLTNAQPQLMRDTFDSTFRTIALHCAIKSTNAECMPMQLVGARDNSLLAKKSICSAVRFVVRAHALVAGKHQQTGRVCKCHLPVRASVQLSQFGRRNDRSICNPYAWICDATSWRISAHTRDK